MRAQRNPESVSIWVANHEPRYEAEGQLDEGR